NRRRLQVQRLRRSDLDTDHGASDSRSIVIVEAPRRPPEPDELEALIKEARRRARRRRAAFVLAALVAGGIGAGLFAALGGGPPQATPVGAGPAQPVSGAQERQQIERAARQTTIVESGLMAPGFGWAMNGLGLWLTADGGRHWRASVPPHVRAI